MKKVWGKRKKKKERKKERKKKERKKEKKERKKNVFIKNALNRSNVTVKIYNVIKDFYSNAVLFNFLFIIK